jgi:hypothetical protein
MVQRAAGVLVVALLLAAPAHAQPSSTSPSQAPTETVTTAPPKGSVAYGAALRARWVSVPSWFLDLFTKKNVPLSSYGVGAEFFRRKGDMDIVLGLTYQRMSPPDGNWLGKGKSAAIDTDLVMFRNFALLGVDASFIWRTEFNQYVGMRYGAGLGLALLTGKLLRASASNCTDSNLGDMTACKPSYCRGTSCTEADHKASEGVRDDGPGFAHRYEEPSVPGAVPIIDVLVGVDFHIPDVKGLELRVEGGFYDAFFLGLASAYIF